MLKAKLGSKDGTDIFLLGLSEMNVQELKKGHPIVVDMIALAGPDIKIAIHYGETEKALADELYQHTIGRGQPTPTPENPMFHILHHGWSLCSISKFYGVPGEWPENHRWVKLELKDQATCKVCKERA